MVNYLDWSPEMGDMRRDLLAIEVVVVTFLAALRAFALDPDPDVRRRLVERARATALSALDAAERNMSYLPDSPLDRALQEARRRIQTVAPPT